VDVRVGERVWEGCAPVSNLRCAQRILVGACAAVAPRRPFGNEAARRGERGTRSYVKCSRKEVRVASKSGLDWRILLTLSTAYMAVEWCLEKIFPISG